MKLEIIQEHTNIKIMVDGELWRSVSSKTFSPILKQIADCLSREDLKSLFAKEEPKIALSIAAKMLGRAALPTAQLERLLLERGFSQPVVQGVIKRFSDEGWLCDVEWAASFARMRAAKGYGQKRIEQELKQRGLKSEGIAEVFHGERERLQKLIERRYSPIKTAKERARAINSLCRRGFPLPLVFELLPLAEL